MVPAQAHDDGSSSPGSRIFSTRTYAEPVSAASRSRYCTGVAQPVGVIDPQPVDQADVEPPLDLGVRRVEHLGLLDPDPGQRGHREEPPVVELGVAAPPRDQLVVLLVEGRGRRRHRQPELVVAHLARVGVHLDRALVVVAHDRHEEPAGTRVPVDVEVRREPGRGSVLQHVPPPGGRPGRGDPDVVGHDVDQHAHAQRARRRGQHVQPGRPRRARGPRACARRRRTRARCRPPRPAAERGRPSRRRGRAGRAAASPPRTGRTPR